MESPLRSTLHPLLVTPLLAGGTAVAGEQRDQPGLPEGAGKAADRTAEKAKTGADAASAGVEQAADWTTDKAEKGWNATKETGRSWWRKTRELFTGGDSD